jgi:glucuronate isomerase
MFLTEDFLLQNEFARDLYHNYAAKEPIFDYHCHLPPGQIAEDRQFENLTQIWLYGDHYKWRAMRSNGVAERFCTGDASDWEKFSAWAATAPHTVRNPLYHWTHLELKSPFGIADKLLSPRTARSIYDECREKLAQPEFSARGLMRRMKVAAVCTTDDPTDTLEAHLSIRSASDFPIRVCPTFRPDRAMAVEDVAAWNTWVDTVGLVVNSGIASLEDFVAALQKRHDAFHEIGCRLSDHGIERAFAKPHTENEVKRAFVALRAKREISPEQVEQFKSYLMVRFGEMDAAKGWTMQLHLAAMRNNTTRMFKSLGPDTGYDSIGDWEIGRELSRFLDALDSIGRLPKTILYSPHSAHLEVLAAMLGNFQDDSIPGKMQLGPAWWVLDHVDGMTRQINALSNMGLLSHFVGMVTDSRSFLSYSRHEYFRRLLCNIIGLDVASGLLPNDREFFGELVRRICFGNAARYLGLDLQAQRPEAATKASMAQAVQVHPEE